MPESENKGVGSEIHMVSPERVSGTPWQKGLDNTLIAGYNNTKLEGFLMQNRCKTERLIGTML